MHLTRLFLGSCCRRGMLPSSVSLGFIWCSHSSEAMHTNTHSVLHEACVPGNGITNWPSLMCHDRVIPKGIPFVQPQILPAVVHITVGKVSQASVVWMRHFVTSEPFYPSISARWPFPLPNWPFFEGISSYQETCLLTTTKQICLG